MEIPLPGRDPIKLRVGAYGASKAALNNLVRRVHLESPWLACWMMNPGFVQTDTDNAHARTGKLGRRCMRWSPPSRC